MPIASHGICRKQVVAIANSKLRLTPIVSHGYRQLRVTAQSVKLDDDIKNTCIDNVQFNGCIL